MIVLLSSHPFAIAGSFLSCSRVQDSRQKQNGRKLGRGRAAAFDHYTFLGNSPLTPPRSQHFALSEK